MNRRIPNGLYGGVRGRGLAVPSYSIALICKRQKKILKWGSVMRGGFMVYVDFHRIRKVSVDIT
jgi:hypothetical protein